MLERKRRVDNGTRWEEIYQFQSHPLSILVPFRIHKWDEKRSHFRSYIFFGANICPDPVSKEMKFCEISFQLKKFSFVVNN